MDDPFARVEDYLDGVLADDELDRFERDLVSDPAVAGALGEILMLRELMANVGPDQPPEWLAEAIEESLPFGKRAARRREKKQKKKKKKERGATARRLRGAVRGAGYGLLQGGRGAVAGLGFAARPLVALGRRRREEKREEERKSLWRRALGRTVRSRRAAPEADDEPEDVQTSWWKRALNLVRAT